jgi:hypothetical protein
VLDEGIPNKQCSLALSWRCDSVGAGFWSSVPAREYRDERHMKALWFWEMCRKSRESMSWLSEMPAELEEEELIREETVLATKENSSRWKGHVMLV